PQPAARHESTYQTTEPREQRASAPTGNSSDAQLGKMPSSYFADLPKVSTTQQSGQLPKNDPSPVPKSDGWRDSDTDLGDLTDTMAEQLFGEDTAKMAEAYAAAIREQVAEIRVGRDLARAIDSDEATLLNDDRARVASDDTAAVVSDADT